MFVPRALKLKNAQPPKKPTIVPGKGPAVEENTEETSKPRGPRFSNAPVTDDYLAQLACGIDLSFTDYAHQDKEGSSWLDEHYRVQDGEEDFIHLSAFLDHPTISTLKPAATIISLQTALSAHCPSSLELSTSRYYVRRKPATHPLPFVPKNSFEVYNDEGLSFWDQRTIYVEPHTRDLCKTPAKLAHWLIEHGQLKEKWLPVQAIRTIRNQCAFIVLSGNVTHEDMWRKWREHGKPENWIVMTKVEHNKRTAEYIDLVEAEKAAYKKRKAEERDRRASADDVSLEIAYSPAETTLIAQQPGSRSVDMESPDPPASDTKKKRKRKRKKKTQDEQITNAADITKTASPVSTSAPNHAFEALKLNKKIRFGD